MNPSRAADAMGTAADGHWVGSFVHMENVSQNLEDELSRVLDKEYAAQKEVFNRPRKVGPPRATSAGLRHPTKITSPGMEARFAAHARPHTARFNAPSASSSDPLRDTLGGEGVFYNPPATLRRQQTAHSHHGAEGLRYHAPIPPPRARQRAAPVKPRSMHDEDLSAAIDFDDEGKESAPKAVPEPYQPRAPNTNRITMEVYQHIFCFFDFADLCRVAAVSKGWNLASSADFLWRRVSTWHRSSATPHGDETWKAAFAGHILNVREDLDHEVRELMNIVKRADKTLKQTKESIDIAQQQQPAPPPMVSSSSAPAAAPPTQYSTPVHVPQVSVAQVDAKTTRLEGKLEVLRSDIADVAATQSAAKAAVDAQGVKADQVAAQLAALQREVKLMTAAERRRAFLHRFQKHVIEACFADSQPTSLPVAIRRGTDTFAQMELLCASYPHRSQPWPSNYAGFKVRFHLDAVWWEVHDVLSGRDAPAGADTPPGDLSVAADLMLPYPEGSKQYKLLERMQSVMRETYEALLDTLLR
eukprot:TRINITY_DN9332_c0_g1_i1.p1 TRINITY_DN9332_c0_g1~~TRINITY_DN9332_c0_g1_i1.p1  ORF type:complete len:529 (+),score=161.59 TRINITY_DN9332_c0_g1_i1:90-1676(+)